MAKTGLGRADVLFTEYSVAHLAAAAALSLAGKRVMVLAGESSEAPAGVLPPLGLLPPGGADSLLERLLTCGDVAPRLKTAFRTPPVLFQVLWPGYRVDVCSNPQRFRQSLNREFGPEEAERIERFEKSLESGSQALRRAVRGWTPFPPSGFLARFRKNAAPPGLGAAPKARFSGTLGDAMHAAGLGESARHFISFYLAACGVFSGAQTPFAPAALWLADAEREHALLPPEEVADVRELLQRQLHKRGVELLATAFSQASKGPEGLWKVRTADGREILARYVVEGERALQQQLARRGASMVRARTLRAVIEPAAIPVGMCPRGVMACSPDAPLTGENFIAWLLERPGEDETHARLYATVFLPADSDHEGPSREAVLRTLRETMPFVEELCIRSAWLPSQSDARFLAGPQGLRNLGLAGVASAGFGRHRLALGRSNAPLLGVWGELKCAFSLADEIAGKLSD